MENSRINPICYWKWSGKKFIKNKKSSTVFEKKKLKERRKFFYKLKKIETKSKRKKLFS